MKPVGNWRWRKATDWSSKLFLVKPDLTQRLILPPPQPLLKWLYKIFFKWCCGRLNMSTNSFFFLLSRVHFPSHTDPELACYLLWPMECIRIDVVPALSLGIKRPGNYSFELLEIQALCSEAEVGLVNDERDHVERERPTKANHFRHVSGASINVLVPTYLSGEYSLNTFWSLHRAQPKLQNYLKNKWFFVLLWFEVVYYAIDNQNQPIP